jgi:hypothetical protein
VQIDTLAEDFAREQAASERFKTLCRSCEVI